MMLLEMKCLIHLCSLQLEMVKLVYNLSFNNSFQLSVTSYWLSLLFSHFIYLLFPINFFYLFLSLFSVSFCSIWFIFLLLILFLLPISENCLLLFNGLFTTISLSPLLHSSFASVLKVVACLLFIYFLMCVCTCTLWKKNYIYTYIYFKFFVVLLASFIVFQRSFFLYIVA